MPTPGTLLSMLLAVYRLVVALWNACIVFLQVMQSVMQEAKQEAAEVMALLDDGTPMMDAITSTSLLLDARSRSANAWQTLIIARASSFVLLFRLSKRRVLHLEVDESFIATKLEVICTELMLNVQHLPRLLQMPIWMHDTRLVRYTPMKLPFVWREEHAGPGYGDESVKKSIVPAAPASPIGAGAERRSRRKKYVKLLTESALRRRLQMDRVGRVGTGAAPKRGIGIAKTHRENTIKRRALVNATNMGVTHTEGITDVDETSDETHDMETPKQARMERNIHAALSENLSIPNMAQAGSLRKAGESVSRRSTSQQSLRRKRGQFDLYAQGVSSGFSLLSKDQGSD